MDGQFVLESLAILLLVLANGFFALSEFSVIASRDSKLARKREEGKRGVAAAEKLREKPDQFLASVQVGITLVGAMLGVFSGATVVKELEILLKASEIGFLVQSATSIALVTVVVGITILSVVLGELVPKYIALSHPERYARYLSGPISLFVMITSPFSRLLSSIASSVVTLFGVKRSHDANSVDEEEINQMIMVGRQRGVFDSTEEEFVRSVFDFSDSTVRRALKPRTDVIALDKNIPIENALEIIKENGYSRYPVYEESIDHVIGIIYTKDFIDPKLNLSSIQLSKIMRKPIFVPESMPLPTLLKEFQKGNNHLAIVLDEFGGTAGIITLEDVLEELVGEIQDEYDAEAAPISKTGDNVVYADSDVWPGDVNELIESHLPEDTHDTLAGLFTEEVGHIPDKNESTDIADVRLTILAKDENRILRLKVEKIKDLNGDDD